MSSNVKMEQKECENEENSKKQLVCSSNRNSAQLRSSGRIISMKDHRDSCLRLLKFITDSDLTLTQVNGQRKLGPPPGWTGPPPSSKCEIFVGSIPRNYYEPEIFQIFSSVGRIYELRLMMDFSGTNRGYCFIMYATEEEAARAVRKLDQFEIYPGKKIGVVASVNNRRLYISQLSQDMNTETIVKRIYEVTDDVEKVAIYRNLDGMLNYVLVSYMTHRGAAMGRKRLVPEAASLFPNCEVNVEWANPNINPWNVFEETGTCDKDGKVETEKKFLLPVKSKKSILRSKQSKIADKRWSNLNRPQSYKSVDLSNHKTRAITMDPGNFERPVNSLPNSCLFEQDQSSLVRPIFPLTKMRNGYKTQQDKVQMWQVNENLRNTLDQSLLYENLKKNYVQHQSNMILPSISTYFKRIKSSKGMRSNDPRKYSEDTLHHQITANNTPNTTYTEFNDYTPNYSCQCNYYWNKNYILGGSDNYLSTNPSNLVDSLVPKVSGTLIIPKEDENKRQIVLANNVNNMWENVNLSNGHALVDPNSQFINHYYDHYYQNYVGNSIEQNGTVSSIYLPDKNLVQNNFYNNQGFVYHQEPSHEHLSRQFLSSNLKSVGWYPETIDNRSISRNNRIFPELSNGFYDYQVYRPQNATDIAYFDTKINDGSILSTGTGSNDTFACKDPVKSAIYTNDRIFMGNEELFDKKAEKCYMRPILKSTANGTPKNYIS